MLVRLLTGSHYGEVHDLLPDEARAMLSDGRAVLPDASPVAPSPSVVSESVANRQDRIEPKAKTRRTR